MRVGIVGTGFMGSTHAPAWAKTPATIAGFVSKDREAAQVLIEKYGGQLYPDLEALLAEVDMIDICTPTHRHHEMVLQAASAGKHILCEKPLARTIPQALEMVATCQAAGIKLMVAHVVRFFPEYAAAKAQVMAGEIGQPAVIRLTRSSFQPKKAIDNWFLDFEKSGGMMLDLMIHDLDYARWIAGDVESVFAKKISTNHRGAAVDHGLAILRHVSGAISHVESSWALPPPLFRTGLEIAGSNGWIQFDSEKTASIGLHLIAAEEEEIPDVPLPSSPLAEDPYTTEIKAFYDYLVDEKPNPVPGSEGLAALQLALAATESAETGRAVKIEPLA